MEKNKILKNCLFAFVINSLIQTLILFLIGVLLVLGLTSNKVNKNDYNLNNRFEKMSYVENDLFYYEVGDTLQYLYCDLNGLTVQDVVTAPICSVTFAGVDTLDLSINLTVYGHYDFCVSNRENMAFIDWIGDNVNLENDFTNDYLISLSDEPNESINFYKFDFDSPFDIVSLGAGQDLLSPIPYELIEGHNILSDITEEFSGISGFISESVTNLIPIFYTNNSLTFIGILSVSGLAFSVVFLIIALIRRFLNFGG